MRVHVVSDIHLEFCRQPPVLAGGDLLLLCGDTVITDQLADKEGAHFESAREFFVREVSRKYRRTLVLMGNHEHYHGVIEDSPVIYRRFLADVAPNARLLDDECEVIDGVAFVGSTLWATCQRPNNPMTEIGIGFGMSDFRLIRKAVEGKPKATAKFRTADARARHEKAVRFIESEVVRHDRVVVMTHHAPSLQSSTKYHDDTLTPAYCTDLEHIMLANRNITHWLHGHTHSNSDYTVGNTRVFSNQHGYSGMEMIASTFDCTRGEFSIAEAERVSP